MSTAIQLFKHEDFGEVRVVGDSENPRFCLSDVCKVLAIGNPSQVKTRLDEGVISNETLQTAGGMQAVTFINEDGLYDVILYSRKPIAKKFRKWITNQVVPSIRKSGVYMTAQAAEQILLNPDFIIKLAEQVKTAQKERDAALNQVAELKPKADYCEKILQSPEAMVVTIIAKEYGMSGATFNKLLHSYRIQYPVDGMWALYSEYVNKGYTVTVPTLTKNGGTVMQMKWTQKGRYFLYNFLKARGIVPLCEREYPMANLFGGVTA